ncbi:MAG TPA: hypothetical protein VFX03_01200, partial [Thermomicrobiales bacterium]|nr:hypothetical protein [Thermomicrobiales bacterium]
ANATFGLNGGTASNGGTVDVSTSASIATSGKESDAILAQSIGGGGGNGGYSLTGGISSNVALNLAFGGQAGGSGKASAVTVTALAGPSVQLITTGDLADGIVAQSIGGGGGNGGFAVSGSIASNPIGFSLGGNGSSGSGAANVTVQSDASISTGGDLAIGMLLQSIGGGGGNAGFAIAASGTNNVSAQAGIGGGGGAGGNAGAVTAQNDGTIETSGASSAGILAQAIGAGGGNGGFGVAGSVSTQLQLSAGIGGGSGSAGWGNTVMLTNTGTVATQGSGSQAMIAQSIGGGGGTVFAESSNANVILGGSGTQNGGGAVAVTNKGLATTGGAYAAGIVAQSIGAGGGEYVGSASNAAATTVSMGAAGSSGDGAQVNVNTSGEIVTLGAAALGVLAQSIGGGGGAAFGVGNLSYRNGGSGNGNFVWVQNSGKISTSGADADGIVAQSIGGGGGIAALPNYLLAGSALGSGSGSDVTVQQNGVVQTTGSQANGVFAQSAGGNGTGGSVTVNVAGEIAVASSDASAIYLQSTGNRGNGALAVNVSGGAIVQAGGAKSGASSATPASANGGGELADVRRSTGDVPQADTPNAAAVYFAGGNGATLTNDGTIADLDPNGYAIYSSVNPGTGTTITNGGLITGSVWLSTGPNAFTNGRTGIFSTGGVVNLGGGTLTNNGVVDIGGPGAIATTTLNGNYVQAPNGTLAADLNFGTGQADQLLVSGNATLQGNLAIGVVDTSQATAGTHDYTIVSTGGTLNQTGLQLIAPSTAVSSYALVPGANGTLTLRESINFAPSSLTGNTSSFGDFLNQVPAGSAAGKLVGTMAQIFAVASDDELVQLYKELTPATFGVVESA